MGKLSTAAVIAAVIIQFSSTARADNFDEGKFEFNWSCATCHGIDGKGKGPLSSALKLPPTVRHASSNFRSRRRSREAAARGWGRRYIICCTAVEMFGQALLRDPRSRRGERMPREACFWNFLKVGDLALASAYAQTIT